MGCGNGPRVPVLLAVSVEPSLLLPILTLGWRIVHLHSDSSMGLSEGGENYRFATNDAGDVGVLQGILFSMECEAVLLGDAPDGGISLFTAAVNQWEGEYDDHQFFTLTPLSGTENLPYGVTTIAPTELPTALQSFPEL